MTGLEWVLLALVAAVVLHAVAGPVADRVWPPRWDHCVHCAEVEAIASAVTDGVADLLGELETIRAAVEDVRDGLGERGADR